MPDIPSVPCPIQELLLDTFAFPSNDWQETGSRSERSAPIRMMVLYNKFIVLKVKGGQVDLTKKQSRLGLYLPNKTPRG